jgi:serine/threonine protein kinase
LGDGELILEKSAKLRETQLLAMIRHPYIVAYEESYVEEGFLYVVMEYAGGGTMERYTDPKHPGGLVSPSLEMIKSLMVQLVLAGRPDHFWNAI